MTAGLPPFGRYWRTLRHLRAVQFYGRLYQRLARPRNCLGPSPALSAASGPWQDPVHPPQSLVAPGEFLFLHQRGSLAANGWDDPGRDKLWRYNLHYFDDLNATGAADRSAWHRALLADWVAGNPVGRGTGWEPYPTARRIVNWIKWALAGNLLSAESLESLAVQTRWLMQRLEWHLLGNHLFADAKALVFAGLWFEGPEAQSWLATGCRILAREVPEQILADGGQFELSPMYHAAAVEDMLDLVNVAHARAGAFSVAQQRMVESWARRIPAMLSWIFAMSHPDGQIAFFNDAAFAIAPAPEELVAYAGRLGIAPETAPGPLVWMRDSGYCRLTVPRAVVIADMARVGPDYLPGHAHADTLSFELSVDGHRVFVNSGTSVYGTGPERLRQRGTAAHNTVVVDGRDSSEVWSGFRVGRRAYPLDPRAAEAGDTLVAEASHNGYRHLPGRPVHHRRWHLSPTALAVEDEISVAGFAAEARFHLHPDVRIECTAPGEGTCALPPGRVLAWRFAGAARLEPSSWHPEFGTRRDTVCLVVALENGRSRLDLIWE